MTKSTLLVLLYPFLASPGYGEITSYTSQLETVCLYCAEEARQLISNDEIRALSYTNPNSVLANKELVLLVPQSWLSERGANIAMDIGFSALNETEYGKKLIEKVSTSNLHVKLFVEVSLKNGYPDYNSPMWVTERNSRHELYGAFDSNGTVGIIALNNYQNRSDVPYTFLHELFHLLDGNVRTGDQIIDNFLSEYRAILAEAKFHKDHKESPWHDQFISYLGKIKEDAVFKKTLDLLYPETPQLVAIDRDSFHLLVDRLGFRGENKFAAKVGFTSDQSMILSKRDENLVIRKQIKDFFSAGENKKLLDIKYINNIRPYGLNTFDSIGGPRPRGPGG